MVSSHPKSTGILQVDGLLTRPPDLGLHISVLGFYGYIEHNRDISVFINYSKFKNIFNLYIKIIFKV